MIAFLTALIFTILDSAYSQNASLEQCYKLNKNNITLVDVCTRQPLFITVVPDNPDNRLIDSICTTFYPQPTFPKTYTIYTTTNKCDGTYTVDSSIGTIVETGTTQLGNPKCMALDRSFADVPCCDTVLSIRCPIYGECNTGPTPYIFGQSFLYRPLNDSCVQTISEVILENGLPPQQYYALPMKQAARCIRKQIGCIQRQAC